MRARTLTVGDQDWDLYDGITEYHHIGPSDNHVMKPNTQQLWGSRCYILRKLESDYIFFDLTSHVENKLYIKY